MTHKLGLFRLVVTWHGFAYLSFARCLPLFYLFACCSYFLIVYKMAVKYDIALHVALDEHNPCVFDEKRFNSSDWDGRWFHLIVVKLFKNPETTRDNEIISKRKNKWDILSEILW